LTNVHVIAGDVNDLNSLQRAAEATAKITGGGLDILINNAALVSAVTEFQTQSSFDNDNFHELEADFLESFKVNTLGLVHTVRAFLPLICKGELKKVINISTGMADIDLINAVDVAVAGPYSASKAAANVVIAKYSAAHKSEGILFLSISPGYVATERNGEAAAGDQEQVMELGKKFAAYAPHFTRPLTTEESVSAIIRVIGEKSVENGDGGTFISHLGNKQWL
jgi:NAD(P)-dependent dehydrogenase (short-subunit alcohol dehydrogenase family)